MTKPTYSHLARTAAPVTLLVLACAALYPGRACADQIFTLRLTAGEAYVIKYAASYATPKVRFTDNSNSFTVKRSGPHSLTVFSFQPGEGSVEAMAGGEDVTYHVIVTGNFNARRPLRSGTAPPALDGGVEKIAAPVPYAPASAAVPSAPAAAIHETSSAVGAPGPGPESSAAIAAAEAARYATGAVATREVAAHGGLPAVRGGSAAGYPPQSSLGPVAIASSAPEAGYSGEAGSTRTEVVEPTAFGGSTDGSEYAGGVGDSGAPPVSPGSFTSTLSPNVSMSAAAQWHEQPPSVVRQQFTTNPRSFHPEGYASNRAFGGLHNLPPDTITITSGTSQVYDFGGPISRVSIANSRVADVQVLGNHQVMLVGHEPGFSSLVVWDSQGNYVERQIWTEIAGHQEVMLHAIVAEVDLNKLEQMGVDISVALTKYGFTWVGLPSQVATPFTASTTSTGPTSMVAGGTPLPLIFSQNMTYGVGGSNSNVSTFAFFQFIENQDLGRILARPQLLANSGERARFLSGGEIPIVITQALTSTIVFKQYGTSVSFVPTVIGARDIDLLVRPEVSKPDYAQAVQLFGFNVPAFVTRRAETRVRLRDNQTLIIAGLILDDSSASVHKVPYLGDVPYLGALFRQTYWSHDKTELVMSVTPEIVRPLPAGGEVALPTERQGPLTPQEVKTRPLSTPDAARPRF